jgi:hypothetical protein
MASRIDDHVQPVAWIEVVSNRVASIRSCYSTNTRDVDVLHLAKVVVAFRA